MSDDDEDNAMRAMMGFSSFKSAQRPPKEPKEPTTGEFSASGANSAPLAKRVKTNNTKLQPLGPLSSSPPTFWPASLPPPPRSSITATAASFTPGFIPSTQQSPPGVSRSSLDTQDTRFTAPPGFSTQDARYAAPPSINTPSPYSQDNANAAPPGVFPATQNPQPIRSAATPRPAAYTNPVSGISFTQQELNELKRGKKNQRGDLIFFQPSFVEEDPWASLKRGKNG